MRKRSFLQGIVIASLLLTVEQAGAQSITLSSYKTTSIGINSLTALKLASGPTWSDFKNLAVLGATESLDLRLLAEGRSLTAGQWSAVASQLRASLDADAAPAIDNSDTAESLRNVINALVRLSSQAARIHPDLPLAIARLESTKFFDLDSTDAQSSPPNPAVNNLEPAAIRFGVQIVDETCLLAELDQEFQAAMDPLLNSLTGFDTKTSFTTIAAAFPNAVPPMPPANADGSYTLGAASVLANFGAFFKTIQDTSDEAFVAHENASQPHANTRKTTASKDDGEKGNKIPDKFENLSAANVGFQKLIAVLDPEDAKQLSSLGGGAISIGKGLSKLLDSDSELGQFGQLAQVAGIVGGVTDVFGAFAGSASIIANLSIGPQLKKISSQISRLQADMDLQFKEVDTRLDSILTALTANFALINYADGTLGASVSALQDEMRKLTERLDDIDSKLQAYLADSEMLDFFATRNLAIGYRDVHDGADLPQATFVDSESSFYTAAINVSSNSTMAGISPPDYSDAGIAAAVRSPLETLPNFLCGYPSAALGQAALCSGRLSNPAVLEEGAESYLVLEHIQPDDASAISSSRGDDIAGKGSNIQNMIEKNRTALAPVMAALQTKMGSVVDDIAREFTAIAGTSFSNPANRVRTLPSIFGGPGQTVAAPAALSGKLADCAGGSTFDMPVGLAAAVPPVALTADLAGLGSLAICLSTTDIDAGASQTANSRSVAFARYVLETYTVRVTVGSSVVLSRSVAALIDANCTGSTSSLWSTVTPSCPAYEVFPQSRGAFCSPLTGVTTVFPYVPQGYPSGLANPSAAFVAFIGDHPGFSVCYAGQQWFGQDAGSPLQKLFMANSWDSIDASAAIASLTSNMTSLLAAAESEIYADIAKALSTTSSLSAACARWDNSRLLENDYLMFFLPVSSQRTPIHEVLFGNEALPRCDDIAARFTSLATTSITDVNRDEIAAETTGIRAQLNAVGTTIATTLASLADGPIESDPRLQILIDDFAAVDALRAANSLSDCTAAESTVETIFASSAGTTSTIRLTAPDGCRWAFRSSSWATLAAKPTAGSGQLIVTVSPNITGKARRGFVAAANLIIEVIQDGDSSNSSTPPAVGGTSSGSTPTIAPASPTLVFPTDKAAVQADVTFVWNPVPGATDYVVYLYQGNPQIAGTTTATSLRLAVVPGTWTWYVVARNSAGNSASSIFGFSTTTSTPPVSTGTPLTIQTDALPAATVGQPYSFGLIATGGSAPYTWKVSQGTLPPGLTITNAGIGWVVAGTPTASGTFSTSCSVTDAVGASAQKDFALIVSDSAETVSGPLISEGGVVYAIDYGKFTVSHTPMVIFGKGLGPASLVTFEIDQRQMVTTELKGTQVKVDDTFAPIIYVSDGQISFMMPDEAAGHASASITVVRNGVASNTVSIPVLASALRIFSADSTGHGQAAALNQDGTVNSPGNPAAAGTYVSLFGGGEGLTSPTLGDGAINPYPAPLPQVPITATIGGVAVQPQYAGEAPGLVYGILQVNLKIPASVKSGAIPVTLTNGTTASQSDITISVK